MSRKTFENIKKESNGQKTPRPTEVAMLDCGTMQLQQRKY